MGIKYFFYWRGMFLPYSSIKNNLMKTFIKAMGLATIGMLALLTYAEAQSPNPLITDKSVKVGKLKNGFTYYLKYSKTPQSGNSFCCQGWL